MTKPIEEVARPANWHLKSWGEDENYISESRLKQAQIPDKW